MKEVDQAILPFYAFFHSFLSFLLLLQAFSQCTILAIFVPQCKKIMPGLTSFIPDNFFAKKMYANRKTGVKLLCLVYSAGHWLMVCFILN